MKTYWIEHETSGEVYACLSGATLDEAKAIAQRIADDSEPDDDRRSLVIVEYDRDEQRGLHEVLRSKIVPYEGGIEWEVA